MLDELAARYEVTTAIAVLKCANTRSVRLLSRLGFRPFEPPPETACDPDERAMIKCPINATRPPDRAE